MALGQKSGGSGGGERAVRGRIDRRALAVFVVVVTVAVVGTIGFFLLRTGGPSRARQAVAFPPHVAGLSLVEQKTGSEAMKSVSQMHGLDVGLVDGEIATYAGTGGGGQQRVIIWVGRAKGATEAESLLVLMRDRMTANPGAFSKPQAFQIKDTVYYYASGGGMTNYFYQLGDRVVWVGLTGVNEAGALEEIVQVIRQIYLFSGGH